MHRPFAALVLCACAATQILCAYATAQTRSGRTAKNPPPAAPSRNWPIESLTVEGNRVFPTAAILTVAGLKIGDPAGAALFDAARDRLTATGDFETVGYKFVPARDGKGFDASFQVAETTALYPAKFEDLGAPEPEIAAALAARDPLFSAAHVPANPDTLERYAAMVEQFLATRGVRDKDGPVKVSARIEDIGKGSLAALFRPLRALPAVSRITFEGNQIVAGSVLRSAIALAGIGTPYTERHFREVLDASIRPVYEARGRMRVSFPKIRTEEDTDVKGVHVTVTVDEGEVYTLSEVAIAKPSPLPDAELLHAADLKTGDIANFDLVGAGEDRIKAAVYRAGYLDVKVTLDRNFDDAKKTAGITFRIDAGPQYHIGKLGINGLDLDGEAEIKRIWTLKPGDVYNPEYPDHFLQTVRERGIFDHLGATKAETKVDAAKAVVDVTLVFSVDASGEKRPTRRGRS